MAKQDSFRSNLFDLRDRLSDLQSQVDFVTCMDWDMFNGNSRAQGGHEVILRGVRDELGRIMEELQSLGSERGKQ